MNKNELANIWLERYVMLCFAVLAIGLCGAKFLMSISVIGLAIAVIANWVINKNVLASFNGTTVLLAVIFVLHIIWLINSENLDYAISDIRKKLPLLAVPIACIAFRELLKKYFTKIMLLYSLAIVGMGIWLFVRWYLLDYSNSDYRSFSAHISHIRYSIGILIALFYFLNNLLKPDVKYRVMQVVAILFLLAILIQLRSVTAAFILLLVLPVYLKRSGVVNAKGQWGIFILLLIMPLVVVFYHYGRKDDVVFKETTINGNLYQHQKESIITENGHYIWHNVCWGELESAWQLRTNKSINEVLPERGYQISDYLIRYLTSKGLSKDSVGVMALSNDDVSRIQSGVTNYLKGTRNPISQRLDEVFFEIDSYLSGSNPSGHSLSMRLEYLLAAKEVYEHHKTFGVGTGDVDVEMKKAHENRGVLNPKYYKRAHNQFVTFLIAFGVIGFVIVLYAVSGLFAQAYLGNALQFTVFLILLFSWFWEDVLETQAGVTQVAFFWSLMLETIGRNIKSEEDKLIS